MLRPVLLVLTILAVASGQASAQVALQWKFKEGQTFFVEEKISATSSSIANANNLTTHSQQRLSRFTVKKSSREGFELEVGIEQWKAQSNVISDLQVPEELVKDLTFDFQLTPAGKITHIGGFEQIRKRLDSSGESEARTLMKIINDEWLHATMANIFDVLPATPVKKDQGWKHEHRYPMGALGTYVWATTFTYDKQVDGGDQIATKTTVTFQPSQDSGKELGFKVLKVNFTKLDCPGKLVFDGAKGRLVSRETTITQAGTVIVDIAGTQSEAQMQGTEKRTMLLLDKRPE